MTGQQLKNSILQLAIQGRLVAQDPADEPASVLLQRIRQEKQRLVKEGKLKKKDLTTTPITEEDKPFDIPETWEWCRLGDIAFVTKLAGFEYTAYIANNLCGNEGIPLFKGKNVQDGKIVYEFEGYIPETISDDLSRSQITRPCLLTPYVGTIGNIGLHNKSGKYHLGSNVGKIDILCPDEVLALINTYVLYYLRSTAGLKQLSKFKKSTAQESISIQAIREVFLPLPPFSEQRRIVARIEELMPLVEAYGKAQEELEALNAGLPEALKKSILQEAIQGRLVPQDPNDEPASVLLARIRKEKEQLVKAGKLKKKDLTTTPITEEEKPFDIPETWEWCRLGEIASIYGGKRIPAGRHLIDTDTGHIYIRVADMKNFSVNTEGLKYITDDIYTLIKKYIISKDDLYITVAGTIGSVGTIPDVLDGANLTENANKIVFSNLEKYYLLYSLTSPFVQNQIKACTTKVGQPKLAIIRIQNLRIPLPPLSEQRRIVAKIESLFAAIDQMKALH